MPDAVANSIEQIMSQARRARRSRNRAKPKNPTQRFLKRRVNPYYTPMDQQFLSATDLADFVTSGIVSKRIEAGLDTLSRSISLIATRKEWAAFLASPEVEGFLFTAMGDSSGILIADDGDGIEQYWQYHAGNNSCQVTIFGSEDFCNEILTLVLGRFEESDSNLEWIYSGDGSSVSVALRKDRNPISEMYSFLKDETLEEYYDRFMASSASILLLIGKPGTGKTSFIRGFLQHTKSNATVTYDPSVLAKDYVFAQFIEGDANVFIIEDADLLLGSRKEGNDMMHKFLNVGDGLVTTSGKKMIFSTNLESIKDVDQALVRPGRCFDVVNFEELTHEGAEVLTEKLGIGMPAKAKKNYSLAELFHTQTHAPAAVKSTTRKMGF